MSASPSPERPWTLIADRELGASVLLGKTARIRFGPSAAVNFDALWIRLIPPDQQIFRPRNGP